MRGGRAVAELLLGMIEPSGPLPISVPCHVGQQPVHYNQVRGQHGNRYADLSQEPQFRFGEGLSFTTVRYSDLRLHHEVVSSDGTVACTVTLTNTGRRPTRETVQAYVSDLVTSATWAEQELKAFRQVIIDPAIGGRGPDRPCVVLHLGRRHGTPHLSNLGNLNCAWALALDDRTS
jgi:beta-glucosidase